MPVFFAIYTAYVYYNYDVYPQKKCVPSPYVKTSPRNTRCLYFNLFFSFASEKATEMMTVIFIVIYQTPPIVFFGPRIP